MKRLLIDHVKHAELRGSLLNPKDTNGAISSVGTHFLVDPAEPLVALNRAEKGRTGFWVSFS